MPLKQGISYIKNENMGVKDQLKIALVQFDIIWESVAENCWKIEQLVSDYKSEIDILVLPETFNTGFSMNPEIASETIEGDTLEWMKYLASRRNFVVCGSLFIFENGQYFNRFFWVEPEGKTYTYNKRHLFSIGGEDKFFAPGDSQTIIEYNGWKIFPLICYDLRFPVWCRNSQLYDLMINVANWPSSRSEVWKTLAKARAIENQCYVVAVNRIGVDGMGIEYSGDSQVIDPKGIKIFKAEKRETIETVTLDYNQLHAFRKKFNTLEDGDKFTINV
jgi:omega-amidase